MEFLWNKTEWANVENDLTPIFMRALHNDDQKLQFHILCSFIARNQYLLDKKGASPPWHPPYAHLFHLLIRYYYLYHAIWESALFCSCASIKRIIVYGGVTSNLTFSGNHFQWWIMCWIICCIIHKAKPGQANTFILCVIVALDSQLLARK